uniref:GAG-pre-integrase domain-containing protein n=1 Tax=Chenopodium quinoa TaxID=63459 RepID=A0A803LQG4_CHEQI
MMHPLPQMTVAYRMLPQEQKHKQLSDLTSSHEIVAFGADRRRYYDNHSRFGNSHNGGYGSYNQGNNKGNYYNSGKSGQGSHTGRQNIGFKRNLNLFCTHCKLSGHTVDRCFKLNGFPPDFKHNPQRKIANMAQGEEAMDDMNMQEDIVTTSFTREEYARIMSAMEEQSTDAKSQSQNNSYSEEKNTNSAYFVGKLCLFSHSNLGWIIDSGATDHICHDLKLFDPYTILDSDENTITIPDGTEVQITHIGTVKLSPTILLRDVLYVPDFQFNLISVHKLSKDMKSNVIFTSDKCIIQDQVLKKEIVLGKLKSGLYYAVEHSQSNLGLHPQTEQHLATAAASSISSNQIDDSVKLWHLRLGHMPFGQIKHVIPLVSQKGIPENICQICPKAKQYTSPTSTSPDTSSNNLSESFNTSSSLPPNTIQDITTILSDQPVHQIESLPPRPRKPPHWMGGYLCHTAVKKVTTAHWCNLVKFNKSPISWKSKKQPTVSKSSSESEYRAMESASAEVTWMVRLLTELGVSNLLPVVLHCDNQLAIHIAKNPVFHERTKHIDIDCHFTREKILEGLIQLTYLPTSSQLADVLTKVLPSAQFKDLLSKLGMTQSLPSLRGVLSNALSQQKVKVVTTTFATSECSWKGNKSLLQVFHLSLF